MHPNFCNRRKLEILIVGVLDMSAESEGQAKGLKFSVTMFHFCIELIFVPYVIWSVFLRHSFQMYIGIW